MARPAIPEATRQQFETTVTRLRELMPPGWTVDVEARSQDGGRLSIASELEVGGLSVVTRRRLEPRDVAALGDVDGPTLIAAPWFSPRTRALLRSNGFSLLDSTGNADIVMSRPGLAIRTEGAKRDPDPKPAAGPSLRGPRAWALLRTMAEVTPPYGVRELADSVGVDAGYVSRVLTVLEDELLIERRPRGPVTSSDWEGILRQAVSSYSLFGSNSTSTWVAPGGSRQLLEDVAGRRLGRWVVTGSFASSSVVTVAAPEVATIFTADAERFAKAARLLPATTGANVVLAVPYDPIVFERARQPAKVPLVSLSQAAMDCLTGPGRMPEEGEALLSWMRSNVQRWRLPSLRGADVP